MEMANNLTCDQELASFDPSGEDVHPFLREANNVLPVPISKKEGLAFDRALKKFQRYFDEHGSFENSDLEGIIGLRALNFILRTLSDRYHAAEKEPTRTPFLVSLTERLDHLSKVHAHFSRVLRDRFCLSNDDATDSENEV